VAVGGAWHWWLDGWLLVYRLGGLCARQGWAAMMMCNQMLCARHGLVGFFSEWIDVSGLMGSYLVCVLHMSRLYRLCG